MLGQTDWEAAFTDMSVPGAGSPAPTDSSGFSITDLVQQGLNFYGTVSAIQNAQAVADAQVAAAAKTPTRVVLSRPSTWDMKKVMLIGGVAALGIGIAFALKR